MGLRLASQAYKAIHKDKDILAEIERKLSSYIFQFAPQDQRAMHYELIFLYESYKYCISSTIMAFR